MNRPLNFESTPTYNESEHFKNMFLADEQNDKDICKGLVFRGYNNTFKGKEFARFHIGNKQGIKILKRKSCSGCEHCDFLQEAAWNAISDDYLIMPEIEDGKLYSVRVCNEQMDWESGIVDSYDVEVFKLED